MGLVSVLMGGLRMLFRGIRVFLALGVVTLAVMFRGRTVSFCRVFVVLGRLVVFISCHGVPRWLFAPSPD